MEEKDKILKERISDKEKYQKLSVLRKKLIKTGELKSYKAIAQFIPKFLRYSGSLN